MVSSVARTLIAGRWIAIRPFFASTSRVGNGFPSRDLSSSSCGATNSNADTAAKSNRAQFRAIPVHPSITRYIDLIGVGITPRRRNRQRRKASTALLLLEGDRRGRRRKQKTGDNTNPKDSQRPFWTPPPPFATSDPAKEKRRVRVIGSVASSEDSFPSNVALIPEVALAGRSNVGKSTLLNALLYGNQPPKNFYVGDADDYSSKMDLLTRQFRRGQTPERVKIGKGAKAVTSERPGETRQITFFQLSSGHSRHRRGVGKNQRPNDEDSDDNDMDDNILTKNIPKLRLVDLPGYGFSYTKPPKPAGGEDSNDDSTTALRGGGAFQELIFQYLMERGKALKRVLLLIDGRHGLKKADLDFLESLQEEAFKSNRRKVPPIQIVLTKCDLVPRDDLARRVVLVREQLSDVLRRETSSLPVLLVSARAGVGFNNMEKGHTRAKGGILELQKELAALVPSTSASNAHTGST